MSFIQLKRTPWFAAAAGGMLVLGLTACSTPTALGGAEQLPTSTPDSEMFTQIEGVTTAPEISGELIDGTPIVLSKLWQERPIILQFTSSWCTRCAAAEPILSQIAEDYNDTALVVRVALNEPEDLLNTYLGDNSAVGPTLVDLDGTMWRSYAVAEPPLTALIDTAGGVVRMWPGGASEESLRADLSRLITD